MIHVSPGLPAESSSRYLNRRTRRIRWRVAFAWFHVRLIKGYVPCFGTRYTLGLSKTLRDYCNASLNSWGFSASFSCSSKLQDIEERCSASRPSFRRSSLFSYKLPSFIYHFVYLYRFEGVPPSFYFVLLRKIIFRYFLIYFRYLPYFCYFDLEFIYESVRVEFQINGVARLLEYFT